MLLAELLDALGVAGAELQLSSLGTPETRAEYREELRRYLRAHDDARAPTVREPDRSESAARVRRRRPGHARGDGERAEAARPARRRGRRALRGRSARCSTARASPTSSTRRSCAGLDYYTRTLFEFISDALGAQSGVAGGGRYDGLIEQLGGPPTPGIGWAAGVERMLLAAGGAPGRAAAGRSVRRDRRPTRAAPRFQLARDARRAGLAAQLELAGRSLQAPARPTRTGSAPATSPSSRASTPPPQGDGSGEQRELEPATDVIPTILAGQPADMKHAPATERLPRHAGADELTADRAGTHGPRRRLGPPPARPRRADLHRPARPLRDRAARLPPRQRARGSRGGARAALRGRDQRSPGRSSRREPENVNPNLTTGEIELTVRELEVLADSDDAAVPARRGRVGRREHCGCATARSTCAASRCRRRWRCATASIATMREVLNARDFLEIETPT